MGAGHTPGPWAWMGNGYAGQMYLATTHSGRRYVMGFRRWGPQGAQPEFQSDGRLVPAKDLIQFEVGDGTAVGMEAAKADPSVYRFDIDGIDHPDARLIAAAPDFAEVAPDAADLLERYAEFIRTVGADDLELRPYLPEVERVAECLRAAIAKATGAA